MSTAGRMDTGVARVSGAPLAVRDVVDAWRSMEAAATPPVARWERHQVAVISVGCAATRLAGISPAPADDVSHSDRADHGEVDQEVSVGGHRSSTIVLVDMR
jgi:hypothetical protein